MIDKLLNDLEKILNNYDGQLWYFEKPFRTYGDEYSNTDKGEYWIEKKIYIGSKEDIERLLNLKYYNYKLEKFDIKKHFSLNFIEVSSEFKEVYRPKMAGDIVEYQDKLYRVTGFSDKIVFLKDLVDEEIRVNYEDLKLIKSRYWEKYKQ